MALMQSSEICFELQRGPVCALLPLIFSHVFIYSNMKFFTLCLLFLLCVPFLLSAQPQDTVHFQWPNQPFNSSHFINGTFCEYRNTLSANHFHSRTTPALEFGEQPVSILRANLAGMLRIPAVDVKIFGHA